mmetsp:Transcript_32938/g.87626  ORF Transcript_32938/g.87626 Transcript_32938/m.87626 type:complete len:428 (+) Transcript_32938:56-1339(+)
MGGGCFKASAAQIHPSPHSVLPTEPSSSSTSAAAVGGQAAAPAWVAVVSPPPEPAAQQQQQQPKAAAAEVLPAALPLQASLLPPSGPRKKPKPTLIKAVKDGNLPLIDELLREGCGIEQLGMWDNTPLLAACSYGHNEAAMKLINHKANVMARNEHGATPLHYASVEGSLNIVEALLAAARANGDKAGVAELIDCGEANVYNRLLDAYAKRTPLCSAAESGFPDMVSTLLAAGARLEESSEEDRTALWLACRHSRLSVAKMLLQHGARADAKDAHGVSVLGAALVGCNEDLVLALLSHGVGDVNDTAGLPLQDAVKSGQRLVIEALLTHGALLRDTKDGEAATPLHAACEKGDEYIVSLLVRARADPSSNNPAGQTAFDLLRRRGLPDGHIMSLLSPPSTSDQDGGTGTTSDFVAQEEAGADTTATT